jgi:glutamyl-tRNA reductase
MNIIVVGLNHTTASVELRERVSVGDDDVSRMLTQLCDTHTVMESVVLSTCNRTEIYAVVCSRRAGEDYLRKYFAKLAGVSVEEIAPHLYVYHEMDAVRHVMGVSCGLDSLVIGETQILGQVRNAFMIAMEENASGTILNQLFRLAVQVGKRAQTETTIGQNPVSVSYAAVQLAKKIMGDLKDSRALVVGAGKMSELAVQHLRAGGIADIVIVNRTLERAKELASRNDCSVLDWNELEHAVQKADIVISSTGARGTVISRASIEEAAARRRGKPLVLIDIAMPRDIDASASLIKHVFLYDIDDLEGVIAANLAERERQGQIVREMVTETERQFAVWLAEQSIVPLIRSVRENGVAIQASVMESLLRKLPDLSEREQKLLNKHTMSIVNQLLREPIKNMKELASAHPELADGHLFAKLFGIEEETDTSAGRAREFIKRESSFEASLQPTLG